MVDSKDFDDLSSAQADQSHIDNSFASSMDPSASEISYIMGP